MSDPTRGPFLNAASRGGLPPQLANLFAGLAAGFPAAPSGPAASSSPAAAPEAEERFDVLLETPAFRVERIVSWGHASPAGFWYDQPRAEWVAVLRGAARLQFDGAPGLVALGPGDALVIPARQRHRVEWTTSDEPTVWLAIHYEEPRGE